MADRIASEKYPSGLKTHLEVPLDPENPGDYEFICYGKSFAFHGKWMIFKHFDELQATWTKIKRAKEDGAFAGCIYLKTSTKVYRPGSYGPGPCTTGVIEVYTGEDNRDEVGKQICMIVKHDIKYKTERATADGVYAGSGHRQLPSNETMLYNRGSPHLMGEHKERTNLGYSRDRPDEWKLNVVMSPHYLGSETHYGKWVVPVTKKEATGVWHILRRKIESEKQGILKMECPSNKKENENRNDFFIHVYTTEEEWESVGDDLYELMEKTLTYEHVHQQKEDFIKKW